MADYYTELVNTLLANLPVKQDFRKVLPWESFFSEALARQGIGQQLERQYQPTIDTGINNLANDYAVRNLLRSGIRRQAENKFLEDTAEQMATTGEQLFSTRAKQAADAYANQYKMYEADPTTFKAPAPIQQPSAYIAQPITTYKKTGTKYGIGRTEGKGVSPYKQTFGEWYKGRFKTNPYYA